MRSEEILRRTEEGMLESNKVLIRELIHDLEEKGIAPVWAIDGEMKKLQIIQNGQLVEFEKELQKFGLKKSDFCFLQEEKNSASFTYILVHKKSAKIKKYKSNKNSQPIAAFHRDLQNNFFSE